MEYKFTFYSGDTGLLHSITALVEDVYDDQIKVKYIKNENTNSSSSKCNTCSSKSTCNAANKQNSTIDALSSITNCNCILNPPDVSKYEGPAILFIPIMNIVKVSYIFTNSSNSNTNNDGGVKIMLLGISATTIRAIIIRMAFFEDNLEEAVKYVDLKAGGIYDLTYEARDGAIYESRVKVMSIEEVDDCTPNKPGKGYVREYTGGHNVTYTNCCSKDEFMSNPPVKKIKVVVDTSETFSGRYESIMLDAIRDCVLIYDGSNESDNEIVQDFCENCHFKDANCHPDYCGHYIPTINKHNCHHGELMPSTYTYTYKNMCKAVVKGEKVELVINGETTNIDLDTLLKYYMGIE